jgi:uncharacterized protein (TIGR03067 family)
MATASGWGEWIDIEFVEGPEAGNWTYGLSELDLDKDALTFCLGLVGSSRPTAFVTSPGSGHALERLKRANAKRPANVKGGTRPLAPARAQAPAPTVDVSAFEGAVTPLMKRLQGEWAAVEMVTDGSKMRDDWLSFGFRKTEGNETKVVFGGQTMLHAKMRIDESAKPIAVDYLNLAGASKGRVSLGILKWDGDEVTFHIAKAGKPRPSEFVSAKGGGTILSRWRRK